MPDNDTYRTPDLGLAVSLKITGFELINLERDLKNKNRAVFLFKTSRELNEFVQKFARQEVRVEPVAFMNGIRNMKALIDATGGQS